METVKVQPVKLHRRHIVLDGRTFTALTLRPSNECRYATNYFHQTWHVLTDVAGARLLGQLCWSLASQRGEATIVVIDNPHLVPNPFDADSSSPIVITNADLGPLNKKALAQLKQLLPLRARSEGSVPLATSGLQRLLDGGATSQLLDRHQASGVWWNDHQRRGWIDRVKGIVVLSAPAPVLQWWAVRLCELGSTWHRGSDYTGLDHPLKNRRDGEVQIFEDFTAMVTTAGETRSRIFPDASRRELLDDERELVWAALPPDHPRG
jgi:hypothetical protein